MLKPTQNVADECHYGSLRGRKRHEGTERPRAEKVGGGGFKSAFCLLLALLLTGNLLTVFSAPASAYAEGETFGITITPSANGVVETDVEEAAAGSVVTFTITPGEECKLKPGSLKVITDSQKAPRLVRGSGNAESPYTFIMPADSVTITAEFFKISPITVLDGIEHGTVTTNVETAVVGEQIIITLKPDEGYRLKYTGNYSWAGPERTLKATAGDAKANVDIPFTYYDPETKITTTLDIGSTVFYFTMPDDYVEITAEFTKAFAVIADPGIANGRVDLRNRTEAGEGERISLDAIAAAKYILTSGTFKSIDSLNGETVFTSSYVEFVMPACDVTFTAEFESLPKFVGENFQVAPGDASIICTFVLTQGITHRVYYRENATEDEYKWAQLGGNLSIGDTATLVVPGLKNGVEYELYLQGDRWGTILAVGDTAYATPVGIDPTGITLTRSSADILLGESVQIVATVLPAETSSRGVTWTSSDEDVATVGIHGMIETQGLGQATITATTDVGGLMATCQVNVVASTEHPSSGSMYIGDAMTTYDENGGTAELPFTVIVPTNRPIFEMDFDFNLNTNSVATVTAITLDGVSLEGNKTVEVGNSKISLGPLPKASNWYNAWGIIKPKEGRFLEAGQVYNFTLTVTLKGTATPSTAIGFSSSGNYNRTVYYYDYDNSPNGERWTGIQDYKTGTITATWLGEGIPTTGTGANIYYLISTPAQLMWYIDQVNTGHPAHVMLQADIDLTGEPGFDGIGTQEFPYTSRFNGNGYSVTYNLTQSTDGPVGFVKYVNQGTVTNLTTKGSINVTGGEVSVGGVIAEAKEGWGAIQNCTNEVTITVSGSAGGYVGGIIGSTTGNYQGQINGNKNLGTIVADGTGVLAVGGIVGYTQKDYGIGGCNNGVSGSPEIGTVTGRGAVGGIIGLIDYASTANFTSCNNYADITGLAGEATGGIVGKATNSSIGGFFNGATQADYGMANYGSVTGATRHVGGIVGDLNDSASEWVSISYNEGNITNTSTDDNATIGGIVGHLTGSESMTVKLNTGKGTLTGGSNVTKGGIIGKSDVALQETQCESNYYAEAEGLGDAAFGKAAQAGWLSYNGYEPQYSGTGGDGTQEDPYLIATLNDFLWFTKQVNSPTAPGNGYHVKLVTDIDLTDYPQFEGIGTDHNPVQTYSGTFDGDGYTITVAMDGSPTNSSRAIFRRCGGATIKNLTITGFVKGQKVAGLALIFDGGTLENVHNYADITNVHDTVNHAGYYDASTASGIISGSSPDVMRNVTNHGTIFGHNAAGLVNTIYTSTLIEDCANYGDVTGCVLAAGILGSVGVGANSTDGNPSVIIRNTQNHGTVTSLAPLQLDDMTYNVNVDPSTGHTASGIVGYVNSVIIEFNNVTNNGTIQGHGNNIAGILGSGSYAAEGTPTDFRIINSTNNGTILSTYNGDDPYYLAHINMGGIVANTGGAFNESSPRNPYGNGAGTQKGLIEGNANNGQIIGPDGASIGSILGYAPDLGTNLIFRDNYTTVEVTPGGPLPAGGTFYDSDVYRIENGRLVEINPVIPQNPTNPVVPQTPNNQTPSNQATTDTPDTATTPGVTTTPSTTTTPRTTAPTPNAPSTPDAGTVSDPPTPLVGSEVVPTKQARNFIEYVIDNPLLIPVGILALALIVGGAAFAYVRFKRNTATDDAGRGRHGS